MDEKKRWFMFIVHVDRPSCCRTANPGAEADEIYMNRGKVVRFYRYFASGMSGRMVTLPRDMEIVTVGKSVGDTRVVACEHGNLVKHTIIGMKSFAWYPRHSEYQAAVDELRRLAPRRY